jgi:hypothetical protein
MALALAAPAGVAVGESGSADAKGTAAVFAAVSEGPTARWGEARVLHASYTPSISPVPLIRLHSWNLRLADAAGKPVDGAQIAVSGGMPEHTHGLPTVPEVTPLGGGSYRIDGLKFHMPGSWTVILKIHRDEAGSDTVRFDLDVR